MGVSERKVCHYEPQTRRFLRDRESLKRDHASPLAFDSVEFVARLQQQEAGTTPTPCVLLSLFSGEKGCVRVVCVCPDNPLLP